METVDLKYADSSSYKLWIKLSVVALTAGLIIAGLGEWFAKKHMETIGDFLFQPGSVLLTAAIAVAGLSGDDLPNGVRITAVIVSGFMALHVF